MDLVLCTSCRSKVYVSNIKTQSKLQVQCVCGKSIVFLWDTRDRHFSLEMLSDLVVSGPFTILFLSSKEDVPQKYSFLVLASRRKTHLTLFFATHCVGSAPVSVYCRFIVLTRNSSYKFCLTHSKAPNSFILPSRQAVQFKFTKLNLDGAVSQENV